MLNYEETLTIVSSLLNEEIRKSAWEKFLLDYPEIKCVHPPCCYSSLEHYRINIGNQEVVVPEFFNSILKQYFCTELIALLRKMIK